MQITLTGTVNTSEGRIAIQRGLDSLERYTNRDHMKFQGQMQRSALEKEEALVMVLAEGKNLGVVVGSRLDMRP